MTTPAQTSMEQTASGTPSHGRSINDLKELIASDRAASNNLAVRIQELRDDIAQGKRLPAKKIDLMETSNKDKNKDLVARIEAIESSNRLTATDREMLQALNARLAIGDRQAMQLAELRDVEYDARCLPRDYNNEPRAAATGSKTQESGSSSETGHDVPTSNANVALKPELGERITNEDDIAMPEEVDVDAEPDISAWPLLYRMLEVNPELLNNEIGPHLQHARKRLALKHDPKRFPNDADAPARWAAISKACEILSHSEKRRWYDAHGSVPPECQRFDLSQFVTA